MTITQTEAAAGELTPITLGERIQALDIIRGFALIGIFLMNVEWFTRPITDLGTGVDSSQTGLSYFASWFIYTFIQGKFWTMFSLLFGMGFAVMLTRAQDSGRAFINPYLRRIFALFLFGSAHYVMIWTGDILHNYAITALALLMITFHNWKVWIVTFLSVLALAAILFFTKQKTDAALILAAAMILVGLLMHFLNRGSIDRYYKWGVALYTIPFVMALIFTGGKEVMTHYGEKDTPEQVQKKAADREERKAKRAKDTADEIRINTVGTYVESVVFRGKQYPEEVKFAPGFVFFTLPLFLMGFWFVRSGVISHLRDNLGMFRKLAFRTLPIGLLLTLASVVAFPSYVPFSGPNPWRNVAGIAFQWAMLPMCIGYVATLICLLHTKLGERILSPLRHAGRMALTNYLGASLIGTLYFAGYGLGHWGEVSRAGQVLFVAIVFALQLLFSRWWLSKFRYGPMEWLWRAITYWQLPAMLRESTAVTKTRMESSSV